MSVLTRVNINPLSKDYRKDGVVYTPPLLATFVASKVTELWFNDHVLKSNDFNINNIKIFDPACGEGELLFSSWSSLNKTLLKSEHTPVCDVSSHIYGTDIDEESINITNNKARKLSEKSVGLDSTHFLNINALHPVNVAQGIDGWSETLSHFKAKNGFDIVIANPPWGADVSSYKDLLEQDLFTLNKGRVETSDLFLELALKIVKPGGYFAFIIPDSIFSHERRELRKLLIENTEIKYIARLGEKIFENINRACAIIICKNIKPDKDNLVQCMRLTPETRTQILNGTNTYENVDKASNYLVKQSRFVASDYYFDINNTEEDKKVVDKIATVDAALSKYMISSRGVELSKTGKVCRCSKCGLWMPLSTLVLAKCVHCSATFDVEGAEKSTIISKDRFKGSKQLLAGESVQRYSKRTGYWISTTYLGINYKNASLYKSPKIIIRKTGVGITATVDYTDALTNQVVYILRSKIEYENVIPIEFVLAIINSRAMFFFLLKKYGESEWRSHPYLTQSQILALPIPKIDSKEVQIIQEKINAVLRPILKKAIPVSAKTDAYIERQIAMLYGLTKEDYETIFKSIDKTQKLLPVKALMNISVNDIFRNENL